MLELTVDDLGTIFDGPHATPTRIDQGPYFLNISSLNEGRLDLAASDHVSETDFAKWTRRVEPMEGDLLFSYETRLGEAALMPAGVRACLGRRMALIRPNRAVVDPRFLLYLYLSPDFQRTIERQTIQGATVNRISLSTMGAWPVRIPEPSEQKAIADVLAALDDKIATNTKLVEVAVALLEAQFSSMGMNQPPNEDDVVVGLHDLVELNPKLPAPSDPQPVYVDMQKLPTSTMSISAWGHRPAKSGARFMNGDTLLARITPCLENRKTGFVDFLEEDQIGIGSTEFIVLRSRPGVSVAFPYFLATSERFRNFAIRHMVGTSGRQRVSALDLNGYTMVYPTQSALTQFNRSAESTLPLVKSLTDENKILATTRDALLPQLISGKLKIKDAETFAR